MSGLQHPAMRDDELQRIAAMPAPAIAPAELAAARTAHTHNTFGLPTPQVPLREQLDAVTDEVVRAIQRLHDRQAAGRIHPAFAAKRSKALRSAIATLRAVTEAHETSCRSTNHG